MENLKSSVSFEGRAVLVTGAGNGLGRRQAIDFARNGARVVVNDVDTSVDGRSAEPGTAQRVVDEITADGGTAIVALETVATSSGASRMVDAAVQAFGRLDAVVHNAGIVRETSFDTSPEDARELIDLYLLGSLFVSQAALPVMQKQGYGRVVFNTSSAGLFGRPRNPAYASAKAGVVGIMHSLGLDPGAESILSNAISPTAITRMSTAEGFTLEKAARFYGSSEEADARFGCSRVSSLALYLASESCRVQRNVFSVAGGRYCRIAICENEGWDAGPNESPTPDDIADHIDEITALVDLRFPQNTAGEFPTGPA